MMSTTPAWMTAPPARWKHVVWANPPPHAGIFPFRSVRNNQTWSMRWKPGSTASRASASTPDVWAWSSRSLPTSVCTNACIASLCAPNAKWMYNGTYSHSFTISARSTPFGCCPSPSSPPSACPSLFSLNIRALFPANPLQTGFFDSLVGRLT